MQPVSANQGVPIMTAVIYTAGTVKVLILGATGGTGRQALAEALVRGYDVTVLVRDRARLPPDIARVTVLDGDVRNADIVANAVKGQDAVVSVLGIGTSLTPNGLIAEATPNILRAMEGAGVKRLVFTSAYGVGETWRDTPTIPRILIRLILKKIYADKMIGDGLVRQSALDWTLVFPTTLTNKPKAGRLRAGERLALGGVPTISRADVGAFLVAEIASRDHIRKGVLITEA
jgi:putative NADH-flavin reductase